MTIGGFGLLPGPSARAVAPLPVRAELGRDVCPVANALWRSLVRAAGGHSGQTIGCRLSPGLRDLIGVERGRTARTLVIGVRAWADHRPARLGLVAAINGCRGRTRRRRST